MCVCFVNLQTSVYMIEMNQRNHKQQQTAQITVPEFILLKLEFIRMEDRMNQQNNEELEQEKHFSS